MGAKNDPWAATNASWAVKDEKGFDVLCIDVQEPRSGAILYANHWNFDCVCASAPYGQGYAKHLQTQKAWMLPRCLWVLPGCLQDVPARCPCQVFLPSVLALELPA